MLGAGAVCVAAVEHPEITATNRDFENARFMWGVDEVILYDARSS
jgi:hypothetical protein